MMSVELEEKREREAWMKPMLLGIARNQTEAPCPSCAMPINENYPPQDNGYEYPSCPHCSKLLKIQSSSLDDDTTFDEMNTAQSLTALELFKNIGALMLRLESGNYQVLFGGRRRSYSKSCFVSYAYEQVLQELSESFPSVGQAMVEGGAHDA